MSAHSVIALSVIKPSPINVFVGNHTHDLSSSPFTSTWPNVSHYPNDNDHTNVSMQDNDLEGKDSTLGPSISSYLENNNNSDHIAGQTHNPEGNVSE